MWCKLLSLSVLGETDIYLVLNVSWEALKNACWDNFAAPCLGLCLCPSSWCQCHLPGLAELDSQVQISFLGNISWNFRGCGFITVISARYCGLEIWFVHYLRLTFRVLIWLVKFSVVLSWILHWFSPHLLSLTKSHGSSLTRASLVRHHLNIDAFSNILTWMHKEQTTQFCILFQKAF